jgi:PTS system galactitol-specific IIC component
VTFIPIGDLPNLMAFVIMIVVATRGNVVRTVIIGLPLIVAQLYIASYMGPVFTELSARRT